MPEKRPPQSARRAVERLEPLARRVCDSYRRLESIAPKPVAEAAVEPEYFAEVCRFHGNAMRLVREGARCGSLVSPWHPDDPRPKGEEGESGDSDEAP